MENIYYDKETIKKIEELPIEENFEIPDGLMMPFGSKVLIKRVGQESFLSRGGIIVPASSEKKKGIHGIIMAIGPSVDLRLYPVKLGMKVEFTDGLEEDTLHMGIPYLLMEAFNIKGAVPPGNYKYPKFADSHEKRRESRQGGLAAANKRDQNELEEKIDQGM